jgi:hypothetical protein
MNTPDPNPPADTPRPRVGTACAVVAGCGVLGLVAVGVLIYLAITLFTQLGNGNPEGGAGKGGPRPDPVQPTQLAKDSDTIKLPGLFDAVARAAGGRYLVLRVPSQRQLVVFDANAAAVVKTLPLDEPNSLFAGTAAKLFVYRPKAHRLERYNLVSWEKEQSIPKPEDLKAAEMLLAGPGSDGPVFLAGRQSLLRDAAVVTIEPDTLTAGPVRSVEWRNGPARVSHDGRLIGTVGAGAGAALSGAILVRFAPGTGFETGRLQAPRGLGHATPSPDGRFVYTAVGVFDSGGALPLPPSDGDYFYTLPTAQGPDLFVSLDVDASGNPPMIRGAIRLHLAGKPAPVAPLPGTPPRLDPRDPEDVSADLRVHLWPAAGLLAVLPVSKDRIELYKVDVAKLLQQSGRDYLVIGSDPPTTAVRGATWSYRTTVWSNAGTPPVSVKSGPLGMVADPKGVVTWPVPADYRDPEVDVRLEATDGGQKAEQAFRVVLTDRAGP